MKERLSWDEVYYHKRQVSLQTTVLVLSALRRQRYADEAHLEVV
jgi:hypothetical protein